MGKTLTALIVVLLLGCAHELERPPINKVVVFHLKLVETLPVDDKTVRGITECKNNYCRMLILKDHYPNCIVEEVGKLTHKERGTDSVTYCHHK